MTQFIITAPNGKKYKVTGANADGAAKAVHQMLAADAKNASDPRAVNDTVTGEPMAMLPPRADAPKPIDNGVRQREDWASYPMDANERTDKVVGMDEATGQQIWETVGGTRYMRGKTTTAPMVADPEKLTAGNVGESVANLASGVVGAVKSGITAPGRAAAGEPVTLNDVMATAALTIPDAPVSAPRGTRPALPETPLSGDVAAARSRGIPVLRTDVSPPRTATGKIVQRTGEAIPFAGTGPMRAKQNAARIDAAKKFVEEYAPEMPTAAIDDVAASALAKREADLSRYSKQKSAVITRVDKAGVVPTPKATAAIDKQIAQLRAQGLASLEPVIKALEDFKGGFAGKSLKVIEENRKVLGKAFSDDGLGSIKDRGQQAINAVYGPLREDMKAFIEANGAPGDVKVWESANARLSEMAGDLKNTSLKNLLNKGEATPEVVRQMLFSQKPSDVARLYKSLTPEGQARARAAIVQEALGKAGGMENFSPEKFTNAIERLNTSVQGFFRDGDMLAIDGLTRALKLTKQASTAGAAPLTGAVNLPAITGVLVSSLVGGSLTGTAAILGTVGGLARVWEATGVQRALKVMARAQTPKAQDAAAKMLNTALQEAGVTAGKIQAGDAANGAVASQARK